MRRYLRAVETGRPAHLLLDTLEDLRVSVSSTWARRQRELMVREESEARAPVLGECQRDREQLDRRVRTFVSSDLP